MNKSYLFGRTVNALAEISPRRAGQLALSVFRTPREGKLDRLQHPYLRQVEYRALRLRNLNVATYAWPGEGPRVLLCHGWESNTARWKPLISALQQQDYHVLALDAPAHGASGGTQFDAILYSEMIDVAVRELRPQLIVGHSAGGMATALWLANYPLQEVRRGVLMATPFDLGSMVDYYCTMVQMGEKARACMDEEIERVYGFRIADLTLRDLAPKFSVPGLVIHDEQDAVVSVEAARAIHELWNDSRLLITKGLQHTLQSKRVYRAILEEAAQLR